MIGQTEFPLSWKTRNLVRFCKRPDYDVHRQCFIANYAFREGGSRFSVLKNHGSLPGPDECFSLKLSNAYPLFQKLLGMEVVYPGMPAGQVNEQTYYNSPVYYRSHIEEVFYCNSTRPLPPIEGHAVTFFPERDAIRVTYELLNKSGTPVAVHLRWASLPDPGLGRHGQAEDRGFLFRNTQWEGITYEAWAALSCEDRDLSFRWDTRRFESAWVDREIPAHGRVTVAFDIAFGFGDTWKHRQRSGPRKAAGTVLDAVRRLEDLYGRLPPVPEPFREFEKLVLNAAGTLHSLKCYEDMMDGRRVDTFHPGKGALASTYFWDGAFTLLGLDLLEEHGMACDMVDILVAGIDADGVPPELVRNGVYQRGYQQPILAWGLSHLDPDRLKGEATGRWYPALSRYVRHWLDAGGRRGNHLGWDDALRWQDQFPIVRGESRAWFDEDWGASAPAGFEKPDTLAHLFLECRALAGMANRLGCTEDARRWTQEAETLHGAINQRLYNEADGFYQDRSVADGRFNAMNTAAGFLPLYAGIAPRDRGALICKRFLLDRERFHSPMPFATLDRRHPVFRSGGSLKSSPGHPDWCSQQSYWIGRAWPHMSYWLLGALCRYGFEKEADAAAYEILDGMSRSDAIFECYDSLTAYGNGQPEFMWSSAAVLAIAYRRYAGDPIGR